MRCTTIAYEMSYMLAILISDIKLTGDFLSMDPYKMKIGLE